MLSPSWRIEEEFVSAHHTCCSCCLLAGEKILGRTYPAAGRTLFVVASCSFEVSSVDELRMLLLFVRDERGPGVTADSAFLPGCSRKGRRGRAAARRTTARPATHVCMGVRTNVIMNCKLS